MTSCDEIIDRLLSHELPRLLGADLCELLANPGEKAALSDIVALLNVNRFDGLGTLRHIAAIAALVDASPKQMSWAACPEGTQAKALQHAADNCALLHALVHEQINLVRVYPMGREQACRHLHRRGRSLDFWSEVRTFLKDRASLKAEINRLRDWQGRTRKTSKKLSLKDRGS